MEDETKQKSLPLFDRDGYIVWKEEWKGMPEYENSNIIEPFIIATFKFRNQDDFEKFQDIVKKYLYNGEKIFDGMQRKNVKVAWYPHLEKASRYRYT